MTAANRLSRNTLDFEQETYKKLRETAKRWCYKGLMVLLTNLNVPQKSPKKVIFTH